MTVDVNKLAYSSEYPIDKIVSTGTVSVVNDGSSGDYQAAKIVSSSIANPYGKKCFVRAVYSINGTDFNSIQSHLLYSFVVSGVTTLQGLKAAVSIGCSNSTVTFRTANGFHGNVPAPPAFTPTSLTFTIKYALFEVE